MLVTETSILTFYKSDLQIVGWLSIARYYIGFLSSLLHIVGQIFILYMFWPVDTQLLQGHLLERQFFID